MILSSCTSSRSTATPSNKRCSLTTTFRMRIPGEVRSVVRLWPVRGFFLLIVGLACADNTRESGAKSDTLAATPKSSQAGDIPDRAWKVVPLTVAPDRFRPGAWTDEIMLWGLVRGQITKLNTQTGVVSTLSQTAWSFFPARGVVSWLNESGTWMLRDGGKPFLLARAGAESLSGLDGSPTALWSPDGSRAILVWRGEGVSRYSLLEGDGSMRELKIATPGYYGGDAVLWLDSARVLFHVVAKSSLGGDRAYRENGWRGALAVLDLRSGAYAPVADTRDSTFLRVAGRYLTDVLVMEWASKGVRGHWIYNPQDWRRRAVSLPKGRVFSSPAGAVVILLGAVADSADAILVTASDTLKLGRVAQDAQPAFSPSGRRGALRTSRGVIVFEQR